MNLIEQRINSIDQIHLTDALNASLLEVKLTKTASTISADTSDLKIYVDKQEKSNPSSERREYSYSLTKVLASLIDSSSTLHSDEFIIKMAVENNDVVMKTNVIRKIGIDANANNYLLGENVIEELDTFPIILFEGENYIYTNYNGISIEIVYPKNTEENRMLLNTAMYYARKMKSSTDFSLDDIYFKDAFTKTENKLNFEIDNINAECITSKNNKFSLDSEGNLVVNSISTLQEGNNQSVLDLVYPIGSIYLSANNVNPTTLFGGVWEQIKDTFLLACGDKHAVGTTGGSEKHSHAYGIRVGAYYSNTKFAEDSDAGLLNYDVNNNTSLVTPSTVLTGVPTTLNSGVGAGQWYATSNYDQAVARASYENTYPTYLAVYVWKRVL